MARPLIVAGFLFLTASATAQTDPSGIDFVTIGSPGNAPWPGNGTVGDEAIGRGERRLLLPHGPVRNHDGSVGRLFQRRL